MSDSDNDGFVSLGWDGLGHIATVNCTPEQARRAASQLRATTDAEWDAFMSGTPQPSEPYPHCGMGSSNADE